MQRVDLSSASRILFVMAAEQEYGPELRRRIRPLITGVGPVEAAIGTALHLHELAAAKALPDLVVSLGSAGSRRYEIGTVWQVCRVSWRDMDASRLGFEKGVTPFADHPAAIPLPTPLADIATASLSTGAAVIGDDEYKGIDADLSDMETFAVVRACQRFGVPVMGLRGVSDGPGELCGLDGWTNVLDRLDEALAQVIDLIPAT